MKRIISGFCALVIFISTCSGYIVVEKDVTKEEVISFNFTDSEDELLEYIDYGIIGIALVLCFYFFKSKFRLLLGALIILLFTAKSILIYGVAFGSLYKLFALVSILLLAIYNGKKGRLNLKYMFYVIYPINLYIHWIINLF